MIINYFDDKNVAKKYFSSGFNSDYEKNNFIHFTHNFKYIPSGLKSLYRNVDGYWEEIKRYE